MKKLVTMLSAALLIIIVHSCETGELVPPEVDSDLFTESELTVLIDNLMTASPDVTTDLSHAREHRGTIKAVQPVIDPINGGIIIGKSKLLRNKKGIAMALKSHLEPGHAYTIWWVVWNFPENCTVPGACTDADFAQAVAVGVDVMYAAGNVAGGSGIAGFAGHLKENDISASTNEFFGLEPVGLLDSKKAEIHLVVRSHGPKIPGQVQDQISSYEGGCTVFFDPFTEIPDAPGECADTQFAIYPPA
ncbi:MAG: hypothetical protein OER04_04475 [Cyclobacteriaceae bacterium]|nr:hypothetical protein [Cyclobacteriaceae bacterium]